LALLKYEASVSAQVAQAFGIDYHNVRKIAEANPLPPIDPQPKEEIDTEDRQSNTFSDACKRVMKYSREEAMRMGNNYIGTELILQGIIREALRYPLDAFVQLDLDLPAITRSIDDYLASSGESTVPDDLPFTPRAKTVLEMSAAEREDLAAPIVDQPGQRSAQICGPLAQPSGDLRQTMRANGDQFQQRMGLCGAAHIVEQ
jgi:ATP-dependent Clp protease ATP-binding subunit ClpA